MEYLITFHLQLISGISSSYNNDVLIVDGVRPEADHQDGRWFFGGQCLRFVSVPEELSRPVK